MTAAIVPTATAYACEENISVGNESVDCRCKEAAYPFGIDVAACPVGALDVWCVQADNHDGHHKLQEVQHREAKVHGSHLEDIHRGGGAVRDAVGL